MIKKRVIIATSLIYCGFLDAMHVNAQDSDERVEICQSFNLYCDEDPLTAAFVPNGCELHLTQRGCLRMLQLPESTVPLSYVVQRFSLLKAVTPEDAVEDSLIGHEIFHAQDARVYYSQDERSSSFRSCSEKDAYAKQLSYLQSAFAKFCPEVASWAKVNCNLLFISMARVKVALKINGCLCEEGVDSGQLCIKTCKDDADAIVATLPANPINPASSEDIKLMCSEYTGLYGSPVPDPSRMMPY